MTGAAGQVAQPAGMDGVLKGNDAEKCVFPTDVGVNRSSNWPRENKAPYSPQTWG